MTRENRIRTLLTESFGSSPTGFELEISDESQRHGQKESHYKIKLVSDQFEGISRLARSRAVHQVLSPEFTTGLHAITLEIRTKKESESGLKGINSPPCAGRGARTPSN